MADPLAAPAHECAEGLSALRRRVNLWRAHKNVGAGFTPARGRG